MTKKKSRRRYNEMLSAIMESVPLAIVGLDLYGIVHSVWNQAAAKMLDWHGQDQMGRPMPNCIGPGTDYPLPADLSDHFWVTCLMAMGLYSKKDQPWQFGIHPCSPERLWTPEEERTFQEIGRRLADGLTSWPTFQDFEKSEEEMQRLNKELEGLQSTLKIVWNELKYKATVTKSYGDIPQTI
jgi:PAS domain-containing protein